jgi:hypothetical protein
MELRRLVQGKCGPGDDTETSQVSKEVAQGQPLGCKLGREFVIADMWAGNVFYVAAIGFHDERRIPGRDTTGERYCLAGLRTKESFFFDSLEQCGWPRRIHGDETAVVA